MIAFIRVLKCILLKVLLFCFFFYLEVTEMAR